MIKLFYILMIAPTSPQVAVASGGVCSAGYVCPRGTAYPQQHPCPVGTWSSAVGAQNLSSCWPCPAGLHCNSTGLSQPSGICDTGMGIYYLVVVSCFKALFHIFKLPHVRLIQRSWLE